MRVLQITHGYPMRYNAGSEVYTQGLAQVLAERHEVRVFTREENAFLPEYAVRKDTDPSEPEITLHIINMARARDGYRRRDVDEGLAEVALGVARRMGQRHEHLLRPPPALPYVVLDDGVLAVEPVLFPEPLEDALCRVALLLGNLVIVFEDAVDDAGEGLQLGTPGRGLSPVARRD